MILITMLCTSVIGAGVGGAMHFKDEVEGRKSRGERVGFLMNLVFGWGIISFLFVWIPLIIALFIGVTPLITVL